jgi:hypothetical protein
METEATMKTPAITMAAIMENDFIICNDWEISINPDDNRFYVNTPDFSINHNFKELKNAVYFARTH